MKKTVEFLVEGMDCSSCAANITSFLEKRGMKEVSVNYSTGEVKFDVEGDLSLDLIVNGIDSMGYAVVKDGRENKYWTLKRKLIFSTIFTLPLFLGHFLMMFGVHVLENPWAQLIFCLPVYVLGFIHFGGSSWGAIRNGYFHMDVLIFIGSTAAFLYSLIGTFMQEPDFIFYETSAMIITLVLLGNFIEKKAVNQTTSAIKELTRLQVEWAKKIMPSGNVQSVRVNEILPGDWLQINEGDKIPVDGAVLKGDAAIDESMLTGESLPVDKVIDSKVLAGSIILSGNLTIAAETTSRDTTLSRMIELVKTAQIEKPQIQRLADKVSGYFVPAVLVIALVTFLLSTLAFELSAYKALMNSIAVLVISCPCAMGLATPTAVMVGVGRLAKNGVLIKGGETLEKFAQIKNFVFDKTGTLTTGKFKVHNIEYFHGSPDDLNRIILKMERHSSHPLAKSLAAELEEKTNYLNNVNFPKLLHIKEIKGQGITAQDEDGNIYRLGNQRFAASFTDNGKAHLFLSKNDSLLASIEIEDEIKHEAFPVMDYLKAQDKTPIILSGDQRAKTAKVANELKIEDYYAEKMPDEKLAMIELFKSQAPTAMIGDGINDAPALAKASIGISLSNASQVAMQSSQVILLNGALDRLPKAMAIARATLQTIRQNLFWAFAYNIVAIPIAALGFLNPMWGALFMAFSDVVVIGNSIRLKTRAV